MFTNFVDKKKKSIQRIIYDFKDISIIALPLVCQGLVYQLQTLTDRMLLGNLNIKYLSVVGNTIFPFNVTTAVISAFGIGITIKIAQNAFDKRKAVDDYCNSILFYNSFISILIAIVWFAFSDVIFGLMQVNNELIPYCTSYVRVLCVFVLLLGVDITIQATLQGLGQTKLIFGVGVCKVILNVVFDIVFIFGKLGFPQMGVVGAALGTSIANVLSTCIMIYAIKHFQHFELDIWGCIKKRSNQRFKEVVDTGLPASIETFIWHISNLVLVSFMNRLDQVSVGIYTLIYNLEITIYRFYYGYAKGLVTVVGQRIGKKKYQDAYSKGISLIKIDIVFWLAVWILATLFASELLSIFIPDKELVDKSIIYVYFTAVCILPKSLNSIVGSGIRAVGDTRWMLLTQIIGSVIVVSGAFIFISCLKLGFVSIYITLLLDESVRSVLNIIYYRRKYNMLMSENEEKYEV